MLGLGRELPDRHVFDHAPAQRAHRLVGHGDAPVLSEVANSSSSRQDAPSRYSVAVPAARSVLPRERFSPLTLIGHERSTFAAMHGPDLLYFVRNAWPWGKRMRRREFI